MKKHNDWTVEDWRKVLWSDESKFLSLKKRPGMMTTQKFGPPLAALHQEVGKAARWSDGLGII